MTLLSLPCLAGGVISIFLSQYFSGFEAHDLWGESIPYIFIMSAMVLFSLGLFFIFYPYHGKKQSRVSAVLLYVSSASFFAASASMIAFFLHMIAPGDTAHNIFMYSWTPEYASIFVVSFMFLIFWGGKQYGIMLKTKSPPPPATNKK